MVVDEKEFISVKDVSIFKAFKELMQQNFLKELHKKYSKKHIESMKEKPVRPCIIDGFETQFDREFEIWCRVNGKFFIAAKNLFKELNLTGKQQYDFIKEAYYNGFEGCIDFNGERLLSQEAIQHVDYGFLSDLLEHIRPSLIAYILENNPEHFKQLRNDIEYRINDGYQPREIAERFNLPSGIDYQKEVQQNKVIDVFNGLYDDACVREKWPTKITRLVCPKTDMVLHPVKYLNQDNLISLAKSLYEYGAGFDDPTYEGMQEFHDVIQVRVAGGDLTLYDYVSPTLENMKLQVSSKIDESVSAPYTTYILGEFNNPPQDEDEIREKLKRLIMFNPEKDRNVFIR